MDNLSRPFFVKTKIGARIRNTVVFNPNLLKRISEIQNQPQINQNITILKIKILIASPFKNYIKKITLTIIL
mgnify:CR=1 FL=1